MPCTLATVRSRTTAAATNDRFFIWSLSKDLGGLKERAVVRLRSNSEELELWILLLELEPDMFMYIYIFAKKTQHWSHPLIGVPMSAMEGLPESLRPVVAIFYDTCMSAQNTGHV
jgi:hypothetical protein